MAKNGDAGGSDQPESSGERVCDYTNRDCYTQHGGVELSCGSTEETNIEIAALELADSPHATNYEDDVEEQKQVGEQSVDAEHDEKDGIIAGEIAEVVIDAVLDFAKVLRFRETLEVKKFANGFQIGKAAGDGLRADTVEAALQVQTRGNGVEWNIHPGGGECGCRGKNKTTRERNPGGWKGVSARGYYYCRACERVREG